MTPPVSQIDCVPGTITELLSMNASSLMKIASSLYAVIIGWLPVVGFTVFVVALLGFVVFKCCTPEKKTKTFVVVSAKEREEYESHGSKPRSRSRSRSMK